MNRTELVTYLDSYLNIAEIKDYGPQGLQVETDNDDIKRIALAVDVSPTIIETAAGWGADMLLVHHGVLWRDVEPIAGALGQRVRLFMKHGLNLYAAHLPLDAHPEVGNNAVLGRMFNVEVSDWWCAPMGTPLGVLGTVAHRPTVAEFAQEVEQKLGHIPRVLAKGTPHVHKIAIISGFGADQVNAAAALGADTLLTGETSHAHYWAAQDHQLNVIFAGHYASETVGVKALGDHLNAQFGLETKFFDFPTDM